MRKVYIVPKKFNAEDAISRAQELGIGEVAFGIPPALRSQLKDTDLPYIYEEKVPTPDESPTLKSLILEVKKLKQNVLRIEKVLQDMETKHNEKAT